VLGIRRNTHGIARGRRVRRAVDRLRQALPLVRSRGRGHVVNISSLAAAGGFAGMTLYCSSKAGLPGFHRVLHHGMKRSTVGLTIAETGPIPTDMLASVQGLRAPERTFSRLRRLQLVPEVPRERVARAGPGSASVA
jgi:NAD(P)-dependent dehydrogenase (short-subunit alcohol dehydrogenase family)